MEVIRRGDIWTGSQKGPMTGKPRPVLVIQNDPASASHPAITVCLITTDLRGTGMIRLPVMPTDANGLKEPSEIQVDQIHTFRREAFGDHMGRLSPDILEQVDEALRRWLDL